jgi:ABC-type lipoprotein export system ATPase subunit
VAQITLNGISKTYFVDGQRIDAVKGVSLHIEQGEFLSIVGHSGSGKTTLLSLIGGITEPTDGDLLIDDTNLFSLDSDRLSEYRCSRIGFMFQFASLLPILTVKENLLLPRVFNAAAGNGSGAMTKKASDLLHMVGLSDKIDAYPSQLSGGQQRRVAIARAFMNDPSIILADEPTGDLDEETEKEMMDFFTIMNQKRKITFLMVTHNSDLAKQTQRRFRMHQGVLREE